MNELNQNMIQDQIKSIHHLYTIGKIKEAIEKAEFLKQSYPNNALLFNICGVCLKKLDKFDEAIKNFKAALEIKPDYFEVSYNLGLTFQQIGKFTEAVYNFKNAISHKPDYAEAYANLGNSLKQLGKFDDAIFYYKKTVAIRPSFAEAHNNLGNILLENGQLIEAKKCFEKAVKIKSDFAEALNNLGNIMRDFGKLDDAYNLYSKALKSKPDSAEIQNNLGLIHMELGQQSSAIDFYSNAISKKKNFAEAYANLGNSQKRLKRHELASKSFQNAIEINPKLSYIFGDLLNAKMNLCHWEGFSKKIKNLQMKINNNEKVIRPFQSLSIIANPMTQKKAAEIFAENIFHKTTLLPKLDSNPRVKRIRIGYFSPDLRNHAVASLISELFEIHDRKKFEIHAFYFGPDTNDDMNRQIKSNVDFYHDVRLLGHEEVAMLARKIKIDIAVDLCGYTQGCRPEIFAKRAAPIQISYLGYPGTMGTKFMDYIIADKIIIPEKNQKYYVEKIIYMPNSYQVNMSKKDITQEKITREELGLPVSDFVFCCFNNSYKITPSVFEGWMQILKNVDRSILWLYGNNDTVALNLKKEAVRYGINPNRLVFASYRPGINNFANRIKLADLFLDSLPYNAHTMASDTLRIGVPILTCMGDTLASRVAASLLHAINLPELITKNKDEYVTTAIELAKNQHKFKAIKEKLLNNVPSSPLFNIKLFTSHLETAFIKTYDRNQKRQIKVNIFVES